MSFRFYLTPLPSAKQYHCFYLRLAQSSEPPTPQRTKTKTPRISARRSHFKLESIMEVYKKQTFYHRQTQTTRFEKLRFFVFCPRFSSASEKPF